MADVLSQSEVESLLAALEPEKPAAAPAPTGARGERAAMVDPARAQISVYDFKRPERVSKEQMRAFQALHEGFSREFGAALSGMLRTIVEVKLISVDQLTYSEFVFSLENPTCFNLLQSEGLDGSIILDLNPSILFPIVDRLLGGGKESRQAIPNRPMTEIELKLVGRITALAMRGLERAWAAVCKLALRVVQVESNPQLVQIVPPNEVIVVISFEIMMGELRGIMNLCIPFNTIEPLTKKLSSDSWSNYTKRAIEPRQKLNLEAGLSRAAVDLTVRLANTHITAREMMNLSVGDVIVTEHESQRGVEVFVEGRPLFGGSAGLYRGHKAVQIGRQIERAQDMIELQLKAHEAKAPRPAATTAPPAPAPAGKRKSG